MLWSVLILFVFALAAPLLTRFRPGYAGWLLGLPPIVLTGYFLHYVGEISGSAAITEAHSWFPSFGVDLTFYLDGLSLLFALLILGVGALIFIYSGDYLHDHPHLGRFYLYLSGFMASMLGLVLAGNVITLFIFWELTSISSYFLIGFEHREENSRSAALQALLVTAFGGLGLLAAALLLGQAVGSFEFSEILFLGETVRESSLYLPILLLLLLGAFTKSAQFPFHFWLPSAMAAPTPVSAYLHSVTMVKAGVYLLARFSPVLGGTETWFWIVTAVGGVTMIAGGALALVQTDFKRLLAYTTINALGALIFLLGIGTPFAVQAMVVYLLVHALYKGALFLVAGVVDHETGTRDLSRLQGLAPRMPLITAAALLAGISMAGIPPLFGFIGKEAIYEAVLKVPVSTLLLTTAAVTANVLLVAVAGVILVRPFFGRDGEGGRFHVPAALALGPVLLGIGCLLFGVLPGLVDAPLLTPAAGAVLGEHKQVHLALWHGFDLKLGLSALTLAAGVLLYLMHRPLRSWAEASGAAARWGPARWYEWSLAALNASAAVQTRVLQNGRLNVYVLVLILSIVGLAGATLLQESAWYFPKEVQDIRVGEIAISALVLGSALLAIFSHSRLSAIVAMGGVGYGVALIYVQFSAPDLAMTQFAVETVTVILFVLVIYRMPEYRTISGRASRVRDAFVALASGGLMTALIFAALSAGHESRLSGFLAEQAYPEAHGRNIVNVILVDFRALDTLGEITVLALAGIGVFGLIKLRPRRKER